MTKDSTRDKLDEARTKIQKLEDQVCDLEKSDEVNTKQHENIAKASADQHNETMGEIKAINAKLDPVLEIINSTRLLGKWTVAILSFVAILITVVLNWIKLVNIFKK